MLLYASMLIYFSGSRHKYKMANISLCFGLRRNWTEGVTLCKNVGLSLQSGAHAVIPSQMWLSSCQSRAGVLKNTELILAPPHNSNRL